MEDQATPTCIGFIVDGNRRWAKQNALPVREGHRQGLAKAEAVVAWARARGIPHLIFYAFSTENWNRAPEEVQHLLALFEHEMLAGFANLSRKGVRVRFIGQRDHFSTSMQQKMQALESQHGTVPTTVTIALSYGGRAEIVAAANRALAERCTAVDEASFSALLDTAEIPDPDMIIRTSGEQRLSNFLPWQAVYSELFFTPTLWPDFTEAEFDRILQEYRMRHRRRGR